MLGRPCGNWSCVPLRWIAWLASAVACGPGSPPQLAGLGDQVAQVGTELAIGLAGSDPDGDALSYGVHADVRDLDPGAAITASPGGTAVFRWTPSEADVGHHVLDFTVSDAAHTTHAAIGVDVRSALRAATAPVFRAPTGTGTTLDLGRAACVDVDIAIADPDTASVQLTQVAPVIDGAELAIRDGHAATWHWCPARADQAEPRHTVVLAADDGDNPRVIKSYLIVLAGEAGASCPGAAPVIAHTARDASSIVDLAIQAMISDDRGIKDAPLLYYATEPPATPPDLSRMTQLSMHPGGGDARTAVYTASVPNPVADRPAGTRQTLYYLIAAGDDDDPAGSCDHRTTSPIYTMTVTSTGAADLAMCAACSHDAQCGAGDACVAMGASGASYCLAACRDGCPAGTTCSASSVTSVDGASAPQCVPVSGTCEPPAASCADDRWEVNDTPSDASRGPALTPDLYDLVSCPRADGGFLANDDWFRIVLAADQRVDLQLAGGAETDLDLHLYRGDGTLVSASTRFDASEEITACLPAATYYVKVNGYGRDRNAYLLAYDGRAEPCSARCVDDSSEDDDSFSQARPTSASFRSTGNAICPGDDDWYHVRLSSGARLTVDLTFTQPTPDHDLDLHLYRDSLDLTPCDVREPALCSPDNGQSGTANEHMTFIAPAGCSAGCDYDVVVRGYDRSSNQYAIAITVE